MKRSTSRGVAKSRNLALELLGLEIVIFIKRSIKETICFKRGCQIQESGLGAPWTGDSYFHTKKY